MNLMLQNQTLQQPSLFKRAQEMAAGKTNSELEQIARNICASKGVDYESALEQFNQIWRSGK